jgi:hypothetical protein
MYKIKKVEIKKISKMIEMYYKTLIAPKDDYWENGVLPNCQYYTISEDFNMEEKIGYFAIGKENAIYQFYVKEKNRYKSVDIFDYILKELCIIQGIVETYDINYLVLSMDRVNEIKVHSYIYTQCEKVEVESPVKDMHVRLATLDDLEASVEFAHESLGGADIDWLTKYYTQWINNLGIYLFMVGDEIAAIGEMRTGFRSKETAYLGVISGLNYRKKGLGKYVTAYLRDQANELGYIAVSSVDANNIGSNKMMAGCGFFPYHRLLQIQFR